MRVLMFSLDGELLEENSSGSPERLKRYQPWVDSLDIVVYSKKESRPLKLTDKITVYSTRTKFKPYYLFQAFGLGKKLVMEKGIEVITTQDPFETAIVGIKLKKKFGLGLNIQVHGDFFGSTYWRRKSWLNRIRYKQALKNLKEADSLRVVSERIGQSLQKLGIAPEKIINAPIYVDLDKFLHSTVNAELKRRFDEKFVILSVGRLAPEKNLSLLIKSFSLVHQERLESRLVIVGAGPEEAGLKSQVATLGLSESVIFTGWQEDLPKYYKSADVLVITSFTEGYNRTAVEALASGLPVIMADVGLAGEIIIDNQNGLVVKKNSAEEFYQAIISLIKHPEKRQSLVKSGLATVAQLPTGEELIKKQIESWKKAQKI